MLSILVFIHIPDELQQEIFHFPLENLVKTFILLNSHVTFPVSNGNWEEKQGNPVNEDSAKRGPDAFVLLGGTCFALSFFFPLRPPLTPACGPDPSLFHLLARGQTHPRNYAIIEDN